MLEGIVQIISIVRINSWTAVAVGVDLKNFQSSNLIFSFILHTFLNCNLKQIVFMSMFYLCSNHYNYTECHVSKYKTLKMG